MAQMDLPLARAQATRRMKSVMLATASGCTKHSKTELFHSITIVTSMACRDNGFV